jgi:hypothetical protein
MKLRIAAVVVFFALASSLVARCDAYQSPFTFRAIAHTGDAAPVPAQLSSVRLIVQGFASGRSNNVTCLVAG